MNNKKKLKLTIFDKEYSLLVDNEEIANELGKYVNNVINETKAELPDQPVQTIAVISALNIAYDLFIEKNRNRDLNGQALDKIRKIKLLLNESQVSIPS